MKIILIGMAVAFALAGNLIRRPGETDVDFRERIKADRRDNPRLALHVPAPIPMILFCPECGFQHVDRASPPDHEIRWTNPPHRSHLCEECGHIWRPADVATVGVAELPSHRLGTNDSRPPRRLLSGRCTHGCDGPAPRWMTRG